MHAWSALLCRFAARLRAWPLAWPSRPGAAPGLTGRIDAIGRATGETVPVYDTATEPGGVLHVAGGNLRETVCPACSAVYKRDARQLVRAGLAGGKGVPSYSEARVVSRLEGGRLLPDTDVLSGPVTDDTANAGTSDASQLNPHRRVASVLAASG